MPMQAHLAARWVALAGFPMPEQDGDVIGATASVWYRVVSVHFG